MLSWSFNSFFKVPATKCRNVPVRVPKKVKKTVCDDHGYGNNDNNNNNNNNDDDDYYDYGIEPRARSDTAVVFGRE